MALSTSSAILYDTEPLSALSLRRLGENACNIIRSPCHRNESPVPQLLGDDHLAIVGKPSPVTLPMQPPGHWTVRVLHGFVVKIEFLGHVAEFLNSHSHSLHHVNNDVNQYP